MLYQSPFVTSLGPMVGCATDRGVCLLQFADRPELFQELAKLEAHFGDGYAAASHPHLHTLEEELAAYFAGTLFRFTVPADLSLGTSFQQSVWEILLTIRRGQTASYGNIAKQLGSPGASQAVGLANGSNQIAIVVPCHRVVGANGKLTGYAGGLERKKWLLRHEGALLL